MPPQSPPVHAADAAPAALRAERDRFVAFAFCGADLLLELDAEKRIVYAAGAALEPLGLDPRTLPGRHASALAAEEDRGLLYHLLSAMERGARLKPKTVRLAGAGAMALPLSLSGYRLADLGGHYFLALRFGPSPAPAAAAAPRPDPESGLYDARDFETVAGERLKALASAGAPAHLTFVAIEDFAALQSRLDVEAKWEVVKTVSDRLRAHSAGGAAAAQIDAQRFGLVHEGEVEAGALGRELGALIAKASGGERARVKAASLVLDVSGMSEADALRALAYTISEYARGRDAAPSLASLSEGFARMIEETGRRIEEVRACASSGDFELAFQPVVNILTGLAHHFEVLTRLKGRDFSPAGLIRFAEDVGAVAEFDLAVMARALALAEGADARKRKAGLSINVSHRSLAEPSFLPALEALLEEHAESRGRVAIEITGSAALAETPAARAIARLRQGGTKVTLDDFAATGAGLALLQTLAADRIKLDGRSLRQTLALPRGPEVLSALAGLCGNLGVMTIATLIEDKPTLGRLAHCQIEYAQGHVYGAPAPDLAAFDGLGRGQSAGALRLRAKGARNP